MGQLTKIKPYAEYISILPSGKGLSIEENMPFEAWNEAIKVYGSIVADGLWFLGDLFQFGERVYGEEYAQAIESLKYSEKTKANAMWVCSVFPPSRRHKQLTFNHHAVVASVAAKDKGAADDILREAEEKELTVRQVTEIKKERYPKTPKEKKSSKGSKKSEDAPETTEIEEAAQANEAPQISSEQALEAQKTLIGYLDICGKAGTRAVSAFGSEFQENMVTLRRLGRKVGFWGGNSSEKKK
jgi:hypothetical protein